MGPGDGRAALRHGTVHANGQRIHYVEQGSGPLIVALHGYP